MIKLLSNKITLLLFILGMPVFLLAESKVKTNPYFDWMFENILVVLALMIIAGVGATLWNAMNGMVEYQKKEFLKEQGIEYAPVKAPKKDSIIKRMYHKAWSLVPIEKEADIVMDHDYDGIRELDNKLPPWWVYTFYVTIVIGLGYLYVYHGSDIGMSQHEEYVAEMKAGEDQKFEYAARQKNAIDEKNLVSLTDEKSLTKGHEIYIANCAACHGPEGQGTVGPNLTDKYWIHGGSIGSIYQTIKNGVPEKGMIAWKSQLQPATIQKVASYLMTLKGTNPPNPKAKQGELYEEVLTANSPE